MGASDVCSLHRRSTLRIKWNIQKMEGSKISANYIDGSRTAELWSKVQNELAQKADQAKVSNYITWQCNPNLLINWDFTDPINQRGQSVYTTANGYTIDMWRLHKGGGYYDVKSHTIVFNNSEGSGLATTAEWSANYPTQAVTASILYSSEVDTSFIIYCEGTNHLMTFPVPAHEMELCWYTATIPEGTTGVQIQIIRDTSKPVGSAILTAAKLELGPVQTLAHKEGDTWVLNGPPPDKALELAKCQRYYYSPDLSGAAFASMGIGIGTGANGFMVTVPIQYPVPMRTRPAISYAGEWGLLENGNAGAVLPVTSMSLGSQSSTAHRGAIAIKAAGIKAGAVYSLNRNNNKTAVIAFDANL